VLPAPFPCALVVPTGLEGTACPAGDIPYGTDRCYNFDTDWLTLWGETNQAWAYEYADPLPEQCPDLPFFWGPSSSGALFVGSSGCPAPPELQNCNLGLGGYFKSKWCYRYRHFLPQGAGCSVHLDRIAHGNVDGSGSNNGVVDDKDVGEFATLLGTRCDYYPGGAQYNPVADFKKDGFIDASDLALLAVHYQHKCSDWSPTGPSKVTALADYPWQVFDSPAMQRAMVQAGVDRDFVVRIWELNGPGQRLFARGERYNREAHLAEVAASVQASAPTGVEAVNWARVKVLYR